MEMKKALDAISKKMESDEDYAWSWHCNIAMAAYDEGLGRQASNRAAARFMKSAFRIDTTKNPNYAETQGPFDAQ